MKTRILPVLIVTTIIMMIHAQVAWAEEDILAKEEAASEKIKDHPDWVIALKNRHHLTDEHIEFMQGLGLTYPQIAIVSSLSERSGKTVEDILDMRTQRKISWGKIADELGLPTNEIEQSIASSRQDIQNNQQLSKEEKKRIEPDQKVTKIELDRKKS